MWLTILILFLALNPGVLFTAPSLGKNLGGKISVVLIHAIIFVILINILSFSVDGFHAIGLQAVNKSKMFGGWTVSGKPPSDPALVVVRAREGVESLQADINQMTQELYTAEENAAAFEPPGSTFREKCMSVRNTSCPSENGQERLFGADDCSTKLGGTPDVTGRCNGASPDGRQINYSNVCAKILNTLPPIANQDANCIKGRNALNRGTLVNNLTATGTPRPTCKVNTYYNEYRKVCVSCNQLPSKPPTAALMDAIRNSIRNSCSSFSAAGKLAMGDPGKGAQGVGAGPTAPVAAEPPLEPGVILPTIASALGIGSSRPGIGSSVFFSGPLGQVPAEPPAEMQTYTVPRPPVQLHHDRPHIPIPVQRAAPEPVMRVPVQQASTYGEPQGFRSGY
jgi:hypothetical protein